MSVRWARIRNRKAADLIAADVFVLLSASENFGIAAARAWVRDPTVASEGSGIKQRYSNYDERIFMKRTAQQLAGAIKDLLPNKKRAATFSRNRAQPARGLFYLPETAGRALHELYQQLISRKTH